MKGELYNELLESIHEGAKIMKGQEKPSGTFRMSPLDIREIRQNYKLTQVEFAQLLNVSLRTLQNWEQGRRTPEGPAKILLSVAAVHPEAILDTVTQS